MVLPRFSPVWLAAKLMLTAPAMADFPLTEDDFFTPMPTVLSVSLLAQPLMEAPVAMTVIDREMIEAGRP